MMKEKYSVCTNCGNLIKEGYNINSGAEYFCCDDCLHGWYSEEEYIELCEQNSAQWTHL